MTGGQRANVAHLERTLSIGVVPRRAPRVRGFPLTERLVGARIPGPRWGCRPAEEVLGPAALYPVGCVTDRGAIDWETWENHGQKYRTWVYGLMVRALARQADGAARACAGRLVGFLHRELYDPSKRLCRLYDFPVGEERVVCRQTVRSEDFHECAYRQADPLECLVDTGVLLGVGGSRGGACPDSKSGPGVLTACVRRTQPTPARHARAH